MQFEMIDVKKIVPSPYNPRVDLTPDDEDFKRIKKSLEQFGCVEPLIVNSVNNRCVGGHQRLKVMQCLGYAKVPVVYIEEPNEDKEKALNIALNKISGKFDEGKLNKLLEEIEGEIDLTVTGFNEFELESMLHAVEYEYEEDEEPEFPDLEDEEPEEEDEQALGNVVCKVATYNFVVEREVYENMLNEVRLKVGFDSEDILEEIKRRLMA